MVWLLLLNVIRRFRRIFKGLSEGGHLIILLTRDDQKAGLNYALYSPQGIKVIDSQLPHILAVGTEFGPLPQFF